MPRLSKIGAACLAAFGWTGLQSVDASYLQVAGGGGGGSGDFGSIGGAGGGAGGYLTGTTTLDLTQSYTVVVGAGGAGGVYSGAGVSGVQGSNSQFGVLTASVGGGFGAYGTAGATGGNGGSGGGGTFGNGGGTATSGQGSNGGTGSSTLDCRGSGGGGGASAVGANGTSAGGGNGGNGTASSITGSSVTYAGGGGGGALYRGGGFTVPTVATGGTGGGGSSGAGTGGNGNPGTANLGGGGGGPVSINAGTFDRGGNGGSGVVIISYPSPQKFGGGIVTTDGTNTIHTFQTSGTLSPLSSLTASSLVVAGGGGGGKRVAGGGGAGGYRTDSGITLDTNSTYLVTVGSGGAGSGVYTSAGTSGSNSVFNMITSAGGGGGGGSAVTNVGSGGSGGGSGDQNTPGSGNTPATSPSQGNDGGVGSGTAPNYGGGGGGGASAVGGNGSSTVAGNGGAGTANSISGTSVTYAGGGGGGSNGGTAGTGGSGGGGAGTTSDSTATAGTANLGGGGGGCGGLSTSSGTTFGGQGGSGVVIISYPGSTQLMAGGTVTITGGNVIHTFTSSGYLTPLTLVDNSLRFRASASAYLNRTFNAPTDAKAQTFSCWIKRGLLGNGAAEYYLLTSGTGATECRLVFNTNDTFTIFLNNTTFRTTTQVFRDPAAWYHIVVTLDTSNAIANNRLLMYVNGVVVTAFSTNATVTQNATFNMFSGVAHNLCRRIATSADYLDGYLTEVQLIDGQALTPNSFGTFNSFGVWQPITYGGSYGTNGFYLKFNDATSTTTLGLDSSPQGNNWTTNNISLTAGVTYDSMTDVPTLTSTTAANYAVLNSLTPPLDGTLSNANLTVAYGSSATRSGITATIGMATGKFYWEVTVTASSTTPCDANIGISNTTDNSSTSTGIGFYVGYTANGWSYYGGDGTKYNNASGAAYGASFATNDVIGVTFDADARTLTFYKNNVSQGVAFTGLAAGTYFPAISDGGGLGTITMAINFGQRPFSYTPPTGFLPLNTFNL
jgi:hypothetical protein